MAVITPSALISEIRGSVGMQTFSKNRWGPYVKAKLVQVNPNTLPQQDVRAAQAAAVAEWQALTQAVMNKWIDYANGNVISGRISRKFVRAGYSEYISRCMNRFAVSGMGSGFEPLPKVRLFPIITNLSQGVADISVSFDTMKPIGNCDLVVYATPPISPGINEINPSLFRIIGTITPAAQISSANIYSAYTSTFPLAAPDIGQKIGIALKAVNTDNFAAGRFFFIQTIISASLIPNVPVFVQLNRQNANVPDNITPFIFQFTSPPTDGSLLVITFGTNQSRTVTLDGSWIQLFSSLTSPSSWIYYKIAASEPASYEGFWSSGTSPSTYCLMEFSGVDILDPISLVATSPRSSVISHTLLAAGYNTRASAFYVGFASAQATRDSSINLSFSELFGLTGANQITPHGREFISSVFIQDLICTWNLASANKRFNLISVNG